MRKPKGESILVSKCLNSAWETLYSHLLTNITKLVATLTWRIEDSHLEDTNRHGSPTFVWHTYVTDNSMNILDELVYKGIYRDDGIAVFNRPVTISEVAKWLGIFQARVSNLADSKFLEYAAKVWGNDSDDGKRYKAVGTTNKTFSVSRYGNLLVSARQSTVQSIPKRESSTEIFQTGKYARRCMFRCHSYRTHEKTSISWNKNREIRVNDDGRTLPSAR